MRAMASLAAVLLVSCGPVAMPSVPSAPAIPTQPPASTTPPASSGPALDWFIQDVCLNASGSPLAGVSLADTSCAAHRDLAPGEPLPYHKQDIGGAVWEDSFPAVTPAYGTVAIVIENEAPLGVYRPGDGAQITVVSPQTVSWVATIDHHGVVAYLGPHCAMPVTPAALVDSWVIAATDEKGNLVPNGSMTAHLSRWTNPPFVCPAKLDSALTTWITQPMTWTIREGAQTVTATLSTLMFTHQGTDHAERNWFTRELGRVMWAQYDATGKAVDAAKSCPDAALVPSPSAGWIMAGCREATAIVPALSPSGFDPPPTAGTDDFLQGLRAAPATAAIFATK